MNCLVYKINNSLYAVDAGTVVGVENSLALNSFPGQPAFVAGLADIRGIMTPVVSVHRYFGLPARRDGVALVIGNGTSNIAFLTDGVEAIREIDFGETSEAPLIIRAFAGCVRNMTLVDGKPVIFMDLISIIPEDQKEELDSFMKMVEKPKEEEKTGEEDDGEAKPEDPEDGEDQ
jgi:purine-binding chemotaxis protein CheW